MPSPWPLPFDLQRSNWCAALRARMATPRPGCLGVSRCAGGRRDRPSAAGLPASRVDPQPGGRAGGRPSTSARTDPRGRPHPATGSARRWPSPCGHRRAPGARTPSACGWGTRSAALFCRRPPCPTGSPSPHPTRMRPRETVAGVPPSPPGGGVGLAQRAGGLRGRGIRPVRPPAARGGNGRGVGAGGRGPSRPVAELADQRGSAGRSGHPGSARRG